MNDNDYVNRERMKIAKKFGGAECREDLNADKITRDKEKKKKFLSGLKRHK